MVFDGFPKKTLLRWVWLLIKHQKIYDSTNDVSLSLPSLKLLCSFFKKIKILVPFWLILVTASQQNHEMAVNHTVYPCKWGLLGTTDGWNGTLVSYTQNLIWNWYWLEYSFFFLSSNQNISFPDTWILWVAFGGEGSFISPSTMVGNNTYSPLNLASTLKISFYSGSNAWLITKMVFSKRLNINLNLKHKMYPLIHQSMIW